MPSFLRPTLAIVAVSLAAIWSGLGASATRAQAEPGNGAPFMPGEVIVRMAPGSTLEDLGVNRSLVRRQALSDEHATIAVPEGSEPGVIDRLEQSDDVLYAELNTLSYPAFIPNDAEYPLQWGMPMLGLEEAWNKTRGDGVAIAVVDTGIAFENRGEFARSPQLTNTTFAFPYDALTGTTHPNDVNGHGTHVAGTLAQNTNDGAGPAGVAPDALIIPVKVCLAIGCPADALADGVRWAVDHGASVINMSLGGRSISRTEREAYEYAEARGVVVVAAAGNGGPDSIGDNHLDYPAAISTVVSVGSVVMDRSRAAYSNYGRHEDDGLHVVAPGGSNLSDADGNGHPDGILQNTFAHACGSGTVDYSAFTSCYFEGTSMATPHVAGTAALLLAVFPSLTPAEVRTALRCSAQDLGSPGYDVEFGAGLVRADVALRDSDNDGRPDCLEEPASFLITTEDFSVPPGSEFSAPLRAYVSGQGLSEYSVTVNFDATVLEVLSCAASRGSCVLSRGAATISTDDAAATVGEFRLAELRFRVIGAGGSSTALSIHAGAAPTSSSDPTPVISTQDGDVQVVSPPPTVFGDVDCLGFVDVVDLTLMLAQMAGAPPSVCSGQADVDCSGTLDTTDIRLLLT
jgi:serine protease